MQAPTGRLAPSPTGHLHLGHARTFLLAWWHARSRGGRLLLRFEDLDHSRVRPEYESAALRDLEWLGLDWDGPPTRQSERLPLYRQALDHLAAQGLLYPCTCTRREIALAIGAPHAEDERPYPGTCRDRPPTSPGRPSALRFRTPPEPVAFHDHLAGPQLHPVASQTGDFPVWTRDDLPAYQLAVVVDDADQQITEIVRGNDLLSSTARQILLQRALTLPHPTWRHVPLVTDRAHRRLAKRTPGLALTTLRESRLDPRRAVTWAARTSGQHAPALLQATDLLPSFDLTRLPATSPAIERPDDLPHA